LSVSLAQTRKDPRSPRQNEPPVASTTRGMDRQVLDRTDAKDTGAEMSRASSASIRSGPLAETSGGQRIRSRARITRNEHYRGILGPVPQVIGNFRQLPCRLQHQTGCRSRSDLADRRRRVVAGGGYLGALSEKLRLLNPEDGGRYAFAPQALFSIACAQVAYRSSPRLRAFMIVFLRYVVFDSDDHPAARKRIRPRPQLVGRDI
jgi:hypothetical protein